MEPQSPAPESSLAIATRVLEHHDREWCPDILRDLDLLAALAPLGISEIIDLVDTAKRRLGETRSIAVYRMWLALEARPKQAFAAWYNLGVELNAAGQPTEAAAAFESALSARADLYAAAVNLGLCREAR